MLSSKYLPPYTQRTTRDHIAATIDRMVSKLIYYDRKEDESLPLGAIEAALKAKEVTTDEMIDLFSFLLKTSVQCLT